MICFLYILVQKQNIALIRCGAGDIGLAKIVAPPEYCARKAGYADVDVTVQTPIEQEAGLKSELEIPPAPGLLQGCFALLTKGG